MASMSSRPLCIYHGNCADGFAAAWTVWKYFDRAIDFHQGVYNEPPPDVSSRDVIIVDFSYKLPVMAKIIDECHTLLWLDHHKSAIEEMEPFLRDLDFIRAAKIHVVLDQERSGAMITWDHFFKSQDPPQLLKHIQDRDLWKFELPNTEVIQAALFSYSYNFDVWNTLMMDLHFIEELRKDGLAIGRKHHKDIDELLKVTRRRMIIGSHDVPVANLPYTMSSDAGHVMAKGERFASCYWDTPKGRVFSLRSAPDGLDVAEVAQKYGGGGHKHASGFTMPIGWEGDK
jgi:oligoribonuclease NrnB/cAMP/cGMP phosphodiesterase (DHH superfamily)